MSFDSRNDLELFNENERLSQRIRDLEEQLNSARLQGQKDRMNFSNILDAIPSAIVLVNTATRKLSFLNKQAMELYSTNSRELEITEHFRRTSVLQPDGLPFLQENSPVNRTINHGEVLKDVEVLVEIANSRRFPARVSTAPIYNSEGKTSSIVLHFADITEVKALAIANELMQKTHMEIEKRFNFALESANLGLFDWNMSDNTNYHSPQWKKPLGYEEHELEDVYDTWKSRWHPDDAAKIEQAMEDYLQGKTANYHVTYRICHRNGEWRWFMSRGGTLKDTSGKPYRWIGTNTDITELVNEQQENEELERFFAFTPDLMSITNSEADFIKVNEAWHSILGYPTNELLKHKFLKLVHPDDIELTLATMDTISKKGEISRFINRTRCADGSYRDIEWFARLYEGLIYASGRDVTEKKTFEDKERQYQRELEEKNRLIETILDNAPIGIWLSGETPASIFTNAFFNENFDLTPEEIAVCQVTDNDARSKGGTQHYEEVVTFKDKKRHILQTVKTRVNGADDSVIGLLGIGLDITKLKEDEEALRLNEAKLRMINENMTDTIWVLNLTQRRFTYVSPSVKNLLGFTPEEFLAKEFTELFLPEFFPKAFAQIEEITKSLITNPDSPKAFTNEILERTKNGDIIWVEYSASCRFNAQNEIEAVGVSRNIEERKKAEQEILYLSQHDKLTGLFNRHYFDDKVAEEIERSNRYKAKLSIIILDIDHFKKVNDTWGHAVGDFALQQVTGVVSNMVRQNDTVARMGGEEFLILLPETTEEGAGIAAEKIREALERNVHPQIGRITASFGVAERQEFESYTSWFKRLDDALYQSKNTGRNRVTCACDLGKAPNP